MAKMAITSTSVISMRRYPNRLTPCSNSVSGGLSFSRSETFPNSVSFPVRMTTAFVLSLTTWVPIKSEFVRWLSGVSIAKHRRSDLHNCIQLLNRIDRSPFLPESEETADQNNHEDDRGINGIT